jgi:hypothetical protein
MAGKFVTILNPGYSTLYTRDLPYTVSDNVEGASANVFNPDDTNPLQEGEWLTSTGDGKLKRVVGTLTGSDSYDIATPSALAVATTSGGTELAATSPCFMYFQERGRYDAQLTRKAHVIVGPSNFEFRTKMVVCGTAAEVGERVYVLICKDSSGRLVSALASATAIGGTVTLGASHWYAGVITQFHGTNDVTVLFQPGFGVS